MHRDARRFAHCGYPLHGSLFSASRAAFYYVQPGYRVRHPLEIGDKTFRGVCPEIIIKAHANLRGLEITISYASVPQNVSLCFSIESKYSPGGEARPNPENHHFVTEFFQKIALTLYANGYN